MTNTDTNHPCLCDWGFGNAHYNFSFISIDKTMSWFGLSNT